MQRPACFSTAIRSALARLRRFAIVSGGVALVLLLALGSGTRLTAPAARAQAPTCTNSSYAITLPSQLTVCTDHWMADMANEIGQRPLNQIVIPGSHDSGTYTMNDYERAQNDNLWLQAQKGTRVFDIRGRWDAGTGDFWIFHNANSDVRLTTVLNDIVAFTKVTGHEKEILLLNTLFVFGGDTATSKLAAICTQFRTDLGSARLRKSMLPAGTTVDQFTPNEIWSLPGAPRVITPGCADSDAPDLSFLGYYAWNCYAQPLILPDPLTFELVKVQDGIIASIQGALEGRFQTGTETPDPRNGYGTTVQGFYSLGISSTISGWCLVPLTFFKPQLPLVLDAVKGWYDNDQHNARKNLNILSGDYVEETKLVEYALKMNGGPAIVTIATVGPTSSVPYTPGTWTNQSVSLSFDCGVVYPVVAETVAGFSLSGAVTDPGAGPVSDSFASITGTVTAEGLNQSVTARCTDSAGRIARTTFSGIKIDKTPPVVEARSLYTPGTWANGDVGVLFTCQDYIGTMPVAGQVAALTGITTVSAEGANQTVTGACTDFAGNTGHVQFGPINIDKTAPVITGRATTADGKVYTPGTWTNQDVTVTFGCADTGSVQSGVATGTVAGGRTVTTETAGESVTSTGSCADRAGNLAPAAGFGPINIDKTPPVITASATAGGAPYIAGTWTNKDVAVSFGCAEAGSTRSGLATNTVAGATLTGEGDNLAVTNTGACVDNAGNAATPATFSPVKIDKTAPDAFVQFDAATNDIAVFARDGGSGPVTSARLAVTSAVPAPWDEPATALHPGFTVSLDSELRTYTMVDIAGNTTVLMTKVRKADGQVQARIVNVQYNGGAVIAAPANTSVFAPGTSRTGAPLLHEVINLTQDGVHQETVGDFDGARNATTITTSRTPVPLVRTATTTTTTETRTGLVLLRISTSKGKLAIEF